MKAKTIKLNTDDGTFLQTTNIDNSTAYKDFNYTILANAGISKNIDIKNYTDNGEPIFEINGVAVFGEHLRLLKEFLNQ